MPTKVNLFRIVVASPSDVQEERDLVEEIVTVLNRSVALDRGMVMVCSRWETDTYPGFHPEGPQGLIDPKLRIEQCDLLVGIFWKRLGTKLPDGTTGTEHEFLTAYKAWQTKRQPQIMTYFNNQGIPVPQDSDEISQLEALLKFKEQFPKEGMWWPYTGTANFKELFREHLTRFLSDISRSDETNLTVQSQDVLAKTGPEEK